MTTATELICRRVATGLANERLLDAAAEIARTGAHYLVVIHEADGRFVGLIRLTDIAARSNPAMRILADLVSGVRPLVVKPTESATTVAEWFEQHRLAEAVVMGENGVYHGLITSESVLEWSLAELHRTQERVRHGEASLQAAAEAKERLLTELSHALRTPLNPVLLISSSSAENPELSPEVRQDFRTIARNARLEAKVIEDLIDRRRAERSNDQPKGN